jgi:hypothetical protein
MLYKNERAELFRIFQEAEAGLESGYPGYDDEFIVAAYDHILELENFVREIATDYVELSAEKIAWQRDDYIRRARDLVKRFELPISYTS